MLFPMHKLVYDEITREFRALDTISMGGRTLEFESES